MSLIESESDDLARAQAQALGALLERVGYALWQAAECEDTLAHYVVVRLRAKKGIGEIAGTALLEKAQQQTFGQLLTNLRKAGVLDEKVEARLTPLLKERNWLFITRSGKTVVYLMTSLVMTLSSRGSRT